MSDLVWIATAALGAGFVNALAGGGTLITFPALIAIGVDPISSNVTNTVALCPGYFGATLGQSNDLATQRTRMYTLMPAGIIGGLAGALLLLNTTERAFRIAVPFLILLASLLLAFQDRIRARLNNRDSKTSQKSSEHWTFLLVTAAAIYGGYFGAGLSVILLAVLGLTLNDSLIRLNALKQFLALTTNVAAAVCFLFSHHVAWSYAIVIAIGAFIGGLIGGRVSGTIQPSVLRWIVVLIGFAVAAVYFAKLF